MKYRGIFFDYDYTLGDATEAIVAGFLYGLYTMGYPIPDKEAIRHTVGLMLEDGFTQVTGETDPEKRREFAGLYRLICTPAQIATAVLCDGAMELITFLKSKGVKLAVVSSKPSPVLVPILQRQGLYDILDLVVGPDMVSRPKPDPEGILKAAEALGLEGKDVLYCGDTVIDAAAAKNAGVDFCAILNGTTPAGDMEPYPHVRIAPDIRDVISWLEEELV